MSTKPGAPINLVANEGHAAGMAQRELRLARERREADEAAARERARHDRELADVWAAMGFESP